MGSMTQRKRGARSTHNARRPQFSPNILTPDGSLLVESFSTAVGWIALARHGDVLAGLVFGHTSAERAVSALGRMLHQSWVPLAMPVQSNVMLATETLAEPVAHIVNLADELRRFAEGEPVDFAHVAIDDAHLAPFAKRVIAACRRIPWGQMRSYGQLAAECGSPDAARAVGQAMANNRFPLVVPCHRVLASGGRIGGYSAPQGLRMKRRLLTLEGVDLSLTRETTPA